jgi:hypothetical protein
MKDTNQSSFNFTEDSDYNQEGYSREEIVLLHIKRISEICCKEFIKGYWKKKPVSTQGGLMFVEEYIEDSRKAYINAISFLSDLVFPMGDKEFKEYVANNDLIDVKYETDKEKAEETIYTLLIKSRKLFREINKMFERTNFFSNSNSMTE